MFNIIPLVIILICLAIILFIVVRKLPFLANFDVSSIPEEKQAETKIMEERLKRKAKLTFQNIIPYFKHAVKFFQKSSCSIFDRLKDLEEKYRNKVKKEALVTKEEFEDFEKNIKVLLNEADELVSKEEYEEAEKKYIEIISLEPKSIEAFRGLGALYLLQKNYDEARQSFEYILKLNKLDSLAYSELAEVFLKTTEYDKALENVNKSLEIEPNNPKYLDLLLSICIIKKDKDLAKESLKKFKKVNPENQKIAEFEEKIKEL